MLLTSAWHHAWRKLHHDAVNISTVNSVNRIGISHVSGLLLLLAFPLAIPLFLPHHHHLLRFHFLLRCFLFLATVWPAVLRGYRSWLGQWDVWHAEVRNQAVCAGM